MVSNTVWVLTYESNDYNQHGEYFEAVFGFKPSIKDLEEKQNIKGHKAKDLVENGVYREFGGDAWFLREEELK